MKRIGIPLSILLVMKLSALAEETTLTERAAFFGLDITVAGWAGEDPDGDGLSNREELEQGMDPLSEDTDRDGFSDTMDRAPMSRVYIEWGSPFFTVANEYQYSAPGWFVGAFKNGGFWKGEAPEGWRVNGEGSTNSGRLAVVINPETVCADVKVEVELEDEAGGDLRAGLLDGQGGYVVSDLAGNLVGGKGGAKTVTFTAPFEEQPDAVVLALYRKAGPVTVYRTMLYVDEDGDGLDREQEQQLGSSDQKADSDGDGLNDYAEVFTYGTDPAFKDSDGDGMPDAWEVKNKLNPTVKDGAGDADGDGKSNYLEYRLGRDPNAAPEPDRAGVTRLRVSTPLEAEPGTAPLITASRGGSDNADLNLFFEMGVNRAP